MMKLSIISDTHLGFGKGERKLDAVIAFEEAVDRSMKMADAILFAGDMFDSPYPRSEIVFHAVRILSKLKSAKHTPFSIQRKIPALCHRGMPFIAITGNHERRSREFRDPVQQLESAGLLVRLHAEHVMIDDVCVYGVSSVPERFASKIFHKLSPEPCGAYNILMFHQGIEGFLYAPTDRPSLTLSDLPEGFDLYVNGHIHERQEKKIGDGKLLINGSTILTQLKDEGKKGFNILDTSTGKIEFVELENQRDVLFVDLNSRSELPGARKQIMEFLEKERRMKPIIRISGSGITRHDFSWIGESAITYFKIMPSNISKKIEEEEVEEKEDEIFHMLVNGDFEALRRKLENDYKAENEKLEVA